MVAVLASNCGACDASHPQEATPMVLKSGAFGEAVKSLQRGLNRLGSILLIDGDFGPGTRDAVMDACVSLQRPGSPDADDAFQAAVAALPELFPPLTAAGVTFIAREEVTSAGLYRRLYTRPTWPGGKSGVTIGIGYDLLFVDASGLKTDWGDRLSPDAITMLAGVAQVRGSRPLAASVQDVKVPLLDAIAVFVQKSLPRCLDQTRSIYSQIDALPPHRRTALASLVYNRGTSLDVNDPTRREMREIQRLLAAGQLDAVAEQIDAMVRLWDPVKQSGLIQRRHREATLWRSGFAALQLD